MQSSQFDQSLGPSPSGSHLSLRTDEVRSSPRQSATSHANNAPNSNVAGHEQLETAQRRPQVTIVEPTHDGASWTEPDPQHIEDTDNSVKMTATKSMHGNVKSKPEASKLLRWLRRKQVASSSSAMAQDGISFEQSIPERPSHQPARSRRNSGASNSVTSENTREALQLVRAFTQSNLVAGHHDGSSGAQTPNIDRYIPDLDYVPTPRQYKPSVFGALLTSKLSSLEQERANQRDFYKHHDAQSSKASLSAKPTRHHRRSRSHDPAANNSGTSTPSKKIKWYDKPEHSAVASMLVHSAMSTASPGLPETTNAIPPPKSPRTPPQERFSSTVDLEKAMVSRRSRPENFNSEQALIAELKDIVACRKYLIKLCGAFMKFGAPTHRMEEYLTASARALAIDAEFLYIPGAMICTFIDNSMQANNVEVVRKNSGVDLGRLKDVFDVYKCIIHHKYTAEVGAEEIDKIQKRPDLHHVWFRVLMFGLASVVVGPFSFNTRPIDFGPIFILGCWLGHMQLRVVPKSDQFSNVFEVFACVVIAFVSRGLGSIPDKNGNYIFCFSAVAQSSIAMILPGFLVLNSALELQSRNIVAGSVRMVYAIIYVLFLGFGLLLGTVAFGLINRKAVNDVSCSVPSWFLPGLSYKLLYTRFVWVPLFACCVALIYKAKWSQLPVMALIAVAGHQANFWISTQLSSNLQVANAIGAFVIGCMANLYSRLFHGLAAASMLPAIYCQVPGGLAASGSLVAGVNSSSQIFGNSNTVSVINNGTAGFVAAQDNPNSVYGGTIFNVGYGMVQVAIGISVGLYLSALVIYPFGKRRSGLFSF